MVERARSEGRTTVGIDGQWDAPGAAGVRCAARPRAEGSGSPCDRRQFLAELDRDAARPAVRRGAAVRRGVRAGPAVSDASAEARAGRPGGDDARRSTTRPWTTSRSRTRSSAPDRMKAYETAQIDRAGSASTGSSPGTATPDELDRPHGGDGGQRGAPTIGGPARHVRRPGASRSPAGPAAQGTTCCAGWPTSSRNWPTTSTPST